MMEPLRTSFGCSAIKVPLAAVWAALLFFSPGLCVSGAENPEYGDAIINSSIADARTLVPILASDSASAEIAGLVFNGLVKYDKDLNLTGDLASSWEISDEGKTITFNLKKGVVWHDGVPFTASDVAFTYEKLIDPSVRTPYSGDYERIERLEIVDQYTVRVSYKEPFAPALASWVMWIMPRHLLEGADLNASLFGRSPVGTGPYRFKRWRTGEVIELESNKAYFEGRPYIDRCVFRVIPDEATAFLELETQGVDAASLTPLQFVRQTGTPAFLLRFNKYSFDGFSYTYMGYNLHDPRFSDIRVRQAIDNAVDRQAMIKGVLFGLATPVTGPFSPDSWAYDHSVAASPFDPDKARSLLALAGWIDSDGDGWVEKGGIEFEFTVITNHGNAERQRVAEMIQRDLANVGIRMKIKVVEWSVFISTFIAKRSFDAVLLAWSLPKEPDPYDIWHSTKVGQGEFNFVGYSDPEVDRLCVDGRKVFDQEKRREIYQKVHRLIHDGQPYLFLYAPRSLVAVSSRFRGIEPAKAGISYNFTKWYVPRPAQRYRMVS